MDQDTIKDISPHEWTALQAMSQSQHGTVYTGGNEGTATTDTPGVGKTVMGYEYDPSTETATFKILERPPEVPPEVIWFALGATIAHVSGAAPKSM